LGERNITDMALFFASIGTGTVAGRIDPVDSRVITS
jgi:hypothetical protein